LQQSGVLESVGIPPSFCEFVSEDFWGRATQIASSGGDEVFRGVVGENWLAKHPIRMPPDRKLSKMTVLLRCFYGSKYFVAEVKQWIRPEECGSVN